MTIRGNARYDVVKQPRSLIIISFALLMTLIMLRVIFAPYPIEASTAADMPLSSLIDGLFASLPALHNIIAVILVFINAALITRIIEKYYVSMVHTYLPLIMYLVMAYGIFVPGSCISATVASLLLILSSGQMIAGFKRSYSFKEVFYSALCLGAIPLLYSPAITLILLLPVMLVIYRRTIREVVVAVAGLFIPLLICTVAWWCAGYEWSFVASSFIDSLTAHSGIEMDSILQMGIPAMAFAALYLLLLLYSVFIAMVSLRKMRTRARRIYIHFLFMLLFSAGMLVIPSSNIISLPLMAVPGSLISTVFFIRHRGALSLTVYLVLLALVVYINTLPLIG